LMVLLFCCRTYYPCQWSCYFNAWHDTVQRDDVCYNLLVIILSTCLVHWALLTSARIVVEWDRSARKEGAQSCTPNCIIILCHILQCSYEVTTSNKISKNWAVLIIRNDGNTKRWHFNMSNTMMHLYFSIKKARLTPKELINN
jgi:hypothetical protein